MGVFYKREAFQLVSFILNPTAGKGRAGSLWPDMEAHLKSLCVPFEVLHTDSREDGRQKAIAAAESGSRRIVSVGGDGTLHNIVNAVYGKGVELAVVPIGTGNDFARTAGISLDPLKAAEEALLGEARVMDLGHVCDQVFINVAGVGYDAEVTATVDKMGMFINGQITYIAALIKTLVDYRCANVTVTIDDRTFDARILLLAVGNGKYYGGGMKIVPDAVTDDGVFDIVMAVDFTVLETLTTLPKVYSGAHVNHPKARLFKGQTVTVVSRESPLSVQADGEAVGTTPVTFRILKDAIKVVRPFRGA